ncbi:MAG: hypothetical protein NZ473_04360, partial [Candidatus Kapabacteria bacterium]|nr:hypothetical protein [Candidatus Kapabacteria bacterium]MDW8225745.1 hypothetical protein [Bacteroidota bacterium]
MSGRTVAVRPDCFDGSWAWLRLLRSVRSGVAEVFRVVSAGLRCVGLVRLFAVSVESDSVPADATAADARSRGGD